MKESPDGSVRAAAAAPRSDTVLRLGFLFGAMYFVQGLGEPTAGLITQPVESLLKTWGKSAGEIAAFSALLSWILVLIFVREESRARRASLTDIRRHIVDAVKLPGLIPAAIFLFLWNFNPFSQSVLYIHMTREMQMSEQFYGWTISVLSFAAIGASVIYGLYCRRIGFGALLHACIITGMLSTFSYAFMTGTTSAVAVTVAVGFTYMIATLIQLDLAARVCRPETAATTFAVLMAISNLGYSLSAGLGGQIYDFIGARSGYPVAFQILVFVGAAFTGLCWLVFPALKRSDLRARELPG